MAYQIKDTKTRVILAGPACLDNALRGAKLAGLPKSSVYLITLEKGPVKGVKTLSDLMANGEMDWEKITDVESMKRRCVCCTLP